MNYQHNPDWQWESDAASAAFVVAIMVLLIAVAVTLITILLAEIVRVYRERAMHPTWTSRILWIALAALIGLWLVSGLLIDAGHIDAGAYLAAWSFLAFCLTVEGCDFYERRQPHVDATGLLTYPTMSLNGQQNGAINDMVEEGLVLGESISW